VVRKRVFIGTNEGTLYALSLDDGKVLWSFAAGASFSASPAVAQGRLVIGSADGALYCFGKKP